MAMPLASVRWWVVQRAAVASAGRAVLVVGRTEVVGGRRQVWWSTSRLLGAYLIGAWFSRVFVVGGAGDRVAASGATKAGAPVPLVPRTRFQFPYRDSRRTAHLARAQTMRRAHAAP